MSKPRRKRRNWDNPKYEECECGTFAALSEGKCAECHEADYQDLVTEYYEDRIRELEAFRAAVVGWRENDWPEWFCRRTAEAIADRGREEQEKGGG